MRIQELRAEEGVGLKYIMGYITYYTVYTKIIFCAGAPSLVPRPQSLGRSGNEARSPQNGGYSYNCTNPGKGCYTSAVRLVLTMSWSMNLSPMIDTACFFTVAKCFTNTYKYKMTHTQLHSRTLCGHPCLVSCLVRYPDFSTCS